MGKIKDKIKDLFSDQRTYFWIFTTVMVVPNIFLCFTESLGVFAKIALVLVPVPFYMLFMLLFRRPGIPMLILFPMYVFGALQLVLLYLFGNSIVATDMFLTIASTNSNEAMELLGKLTPSIVGVIILYVSMIVFSIMSIRLPDRLSHVFRKRAATLAVAIFGLGAASIFIAGRGDDSYSVKNNIWPVNIFHNIKLAGKYLGNISRYGETSRNFTFDATTSRADSLRQVYVMVIGETSRALNWQWYGYPRETTPLLSQTEGIVYFTDALTQSNATFKSVPILLSTASAENYGVIFHRKSLITAFKEAGFRTAFFSNHKPNRSFIDFFANEADTTYFLKEHLQGRTLTHEPFDRELLDLMDSELARGERKQLIVLHTYGSHFNYTERYDDADRHFTPDDFTSVSRRDREKLVNAYDNTIRTIDKFLHGVITRLAGMDAVTGMLYVSDHGEDIIDDRRKLFLHASPIPSYYQLHVPFLVWVSPRYEELWPAVSEAARSNSASPVTTNAVFHTMLSMGGIDTPYRNDSLTLTSSGFRITTRHYLDDHNEPRTFDKIGLKSYDIEMFKKQSLNFPASGE